jgi:hypothetical protein
MFSLCLAVPLFASAQEDNMTRSLPFLEVNADARTAGMGDSYMGETKSMFLYNNPSAFFGSEKSAYASYGTTIYPKIDAGTSLFHAVSGGYKYNKIHAFMAGWRYIGGLEIPTIDKNGNVGKPVKPMDWSVDLGYALQTSDNFSISIGVGFIQSSNYKVARNYGFGFGINYNNYINKLYRYSLSANIKDIGPKFKYGKSEYKFQMPTSIGVGGTVEFPISDNHILNTAISTRYYMYPNDASALVAGVGVEYGFKNLVFARGGYHVGDKNDYSTVGLGFNYKLISFDVAYIIADSKDFNLIKAGLCVKFF